MVELNQTIKQENQEVNLKILECVKNAAEATHTAALAIKKVSKAYAAFNSTDKEIKWIVLQEYLMKYRYFINKTTHYTGLYVHAVDMDFYDNIDLNALNQQLRTVIGVVYLDEALRSAANETFIQCLKSLLRKNNLLTDAELLLI